MKSTALGISKAILTFLLATILMTSAQSQVFNLPCETNVDGFIGLDRKAWAGIGNTTNHSEGLLHNFELPSSPGDCKFISNVQIEITVTNVDISGLTCTPPGAYYINIATGCPSFDPASCDPANLVAEPNSPNFNSQTLSYNNPPENFQFDDNLSIDIIPVMDVNCPNGQTAISSGEIILEYQICVTVTVSDATPTATVDLGTDPTVCPGETTTLSAGTFDSYEWGPNGETTPTLITGEGTYTVTVTDNAGCSSTDEISVLEFPDAPISFNPVTPGACNGGSAPVAVNETYSSYNWSNSMTGQTVNLDAGTYTVTVTDINNCTNTATVVVGDIVPPNAGTDNFLEVCNDGTLYDIEALLSTHDPGGTWSDDDFSGIDINPNPTMVDFSSLSPSLYQYTYTVSGTAPCPDDDALITIQVVGGNDPGFTNSVDYCPDAGVINFLDLLGNPSSGGTFVDESGSAVDLADVTAVNLDGLAPGNYEYTYVLGANGPCVETQTSLFINILNADEAGDNNTASVCEGALVDLNLLLSSDATLGGFYSDDDISGGLNGSFVNTIGLAGQTFNFTYTVGSSGGTCGGDMAVITLVVESSLLAGNNVNIDICGGLAIDLNSVLSGADLGGTFSDLTGNGGLSGNILNTSGLPTGNSQYQYLVGDGISCPKDSATITINIHGAPSFTFSQDEVNICGTLCDTFAIALSGIAPFTVETQIYSPSGNLVTTDTIMTSEDSHTVTICNVDSVYTYIISSIEDDNCINDQTSTIDTVLIRPFDITEFIVDTFACINDTLLIGGLEFYNGNNSYIDTLTGQFCDSIVNISVAFSTADTVVFNPTICLEDSILILGSYYDIDQSSIEYSIVSQGGCDSLIQIDVDFFAPADSLLELTLCNGDSIVVNGITYDFDNQTGVENLMDQSSNGCDSLVTVMLTFSNTTEVFRRDTICSGTSIEIGGTIFDESNPSDQILLSGSGCDTLIDVNISFFDEVSDDLVGPFCAVYSTIINGTTYNISNPTGIESFPNASVNGCDSILNINLAFYPVIEFNLQQMICADAEIVVNGTTYDINNPMGSESFPGASSNGCDSLVNIDLSFFSAAEFDLIETLCEGDEIIVNGNIYNMSNPTGIESFPGDSSNGCDSIMNINLSFDIVFEETMNVPLCVGDSLFVGGAFQFSDGTFTDTLQTVDNCDSIIITNLTFMPCQFNVALTTVFNNCATDSIGRITVETDSPIGSSYDIHLEDENQNTTSTGLLAGPNITADFNNLTSGTYSIIIYDTNGIIVYNTSITIISLSSPILGTWAILDSVDCENGTGSISYSPVGGQFPYTYNWSDAAIGDTSIAENITAGMYELTVTDLIGCTNTSSFELLDGQPKSFDVIVIDPSCDASSDGSIEILGLDDQDGPFTITVNGELADSTTIDGLAAGNYQISVLDANLCEAQMEEILEATNDIMFADYTQNYSIIEGDSVSIVGTVPSEDYTYEWLTTNGSLSCTDCALPIANPSTTSSYELLITDDNGCVQTILIDIEVTPKEIIDVVPNIFSPNGDGTNDNFIFSSGSENLTTIQMNIFDRWGNRIYNELSTSGSVSWDGRKNGAILTNGVYIYHIRIESNDSAKDLFGDVTLIN